MHSTVVHHPRYLLIALFAHSSISRSTYITYIPRLDRWVTQHCIKSLELYILYHKTFFLKRNKIYEILTYIPVTNLPSSGLKNSYEIQWVNNNRSMSSKIDTENGIVEKSDFTVTDRAHFL